jgi:SAM-dependent methyltransferase
VAEPRLRNHWRQLRAAIAPPYAALIERAVGEAGSLLDVGCGTRSPVRSFSRRPARLVGVEAHDPTAELAGASGLYDEVLTADARALDTLFEPSSFDVVLAVDVLEHLERNDGHALIRAMEQVARERVVVFTPNGFVPQGEREGNPFQVHRSGWTGGELRRLGYRISGVHGLRFLRGEEARIRWRPRRGWALVADLTQPVAARVPTLAYHLLAVRDLTTPPEYSPSGVAAPSPARRGPATLA